MLGNAPRDVLMAFSSLRNDPRWLKILGYLEKELEESDKTLRQVDAIQTVGKYQGCSSTLASLIEKALNAPDILKS